MESDADSCQSNEGKSGRVGGAETGYEEWYPWDNGRGPIVFVPWFEDPDRCYYEFSVGGLGTIESARQWQLNNLATTSLSNLLC